jgi:hypothetical protein
LGLPLHIKVCNIDAKKKGCPKAAFLREIGSTDR